MNSARDANHPLKIAASNPEPIPKPPGIRRNELMVIGPFYTNQCPFCQLPHRDKRDFMACRATR